MSRKHLSLNGTWRRSIAGHTLDFVDVPGSYRPVGQFLLERKFDWKGETAGPLFLITDGVASRARFSINGRKIGQAKAWVPYQFEIPTGTLQAENHIKVEMEDLSTQFGPMPGRRFDAVMRSLVIEQRPPVFIEEVRFHAVLNDELDRAMCEVKVKTSAPVSLDLLLIERPGGRVVIRTDGPSGSPLKFEVIFPKLWSPEQPALYDLRVAVSGEGGDVHEEPVGFRKIEIRERDFYLNNRRILLKGVCRHEFMTGFGYTPPEAEIRRELAQIRHLGFNYIRLVHSPHAHAVARLAAEVGILISEEPGTCFHDLGDETVVGPALESLRRLVLRDRNLPSILAWFIYNECHAHDGYAIRAAAICRELNPGCLISFADCFGPFDAIKQMVKAADLSFYGVNVYNFFPAEYLRRMEALPDKPVVFTEWGGWVGQGNPRALESLCRFFIKHSCLGEKHRLAGTAFWAWADYEEYSRDLPAAIEGWTIEGLVDKERKPKADLLALCLMSFEMDHPTPPVEPRIEILLQRPASSGSWRPLPLVQIGGDQAALEQEVAGLHRHYGGKAPRFGRHLIDGIEFDAAGSPLLLGQSRNEMVIPVGKKIREVAILGHIAFKNGYPASGVISAHHGAGESEVILGSPASDYLFDFEDGPEIQPLNHGVHLLRANQICRWWKTGIQAPEIAAALQCTIHPSYEILQINLWRRSWASTRFLREIRWRLKDTGSLQALYAVSVLE